MPTPTALINVTPQDGPVSMPIFVATTKFAKMKILVIDDEPANVALLEATLADNYYSRVKSVIDSREAIETYKTFQPDLILLDLMMPYVDGITILETIRSDITGLF